MRRRVARGKPPPRRLKKLKTSDEVEILRSELAGMQARLDEQKAQTDEMKNRYLRAQSGFRELPPPQRPRFGARP